MTDIFHGFNIWILGTFLIIGTILSAADYEMESTTTLVLGVIALTLSRFGEYIYTKIVRLIKRKR